MTSDKLKIPPALAAWRETADLIARTGGEKVETVLHDLSNPLHSVVYVVNGAVTDRKVGQGLRHLVTEMLAAQGQDTDHLPVWWYRYRGKLIRCTTQLIRDEKGALAGTLCVNEDVTEHLALFERLKTKLPGLKNVAATLPEGDGIFWDEERSRATPVEAVESQGSVRDMVTKLITEMAKEEQISAASSREERRRFVELLDVREVFLVKGSVEYAADVIGVSKVTIYSDLDAVRRTKATTSSN